MELLLARHPSRLSAKHPRLIEDLLEPAASGQQEAVNAIIGMLEDLNHHGLESRYVKKLAGIRVWELKTRARGGMKGGARVYLYVTSAGEALLLNAEVKAGDQASVKKLAEAAEIIRAYERGMPVVQRRKTWARSSRSEAPGSTRSSLTSTRNPTPKRWRCSRSCVIAKHEIAKHEMNNS